MDQGTDYNTAATLINFVSDHYCKTSTSDYCVSPAGVAKVAEEDLRVRRYGYAMLAPILLMTIFSLRQWWRLEKSWNRLRTLPLVLLQVFPQYRALRILYLGLQKKASWRAEKDVYDRDLTSLEPNLEAIPETYIVLAYSISDGGWLGWGFLVSLVISIFSGGFGIAEFMKTGPCKMIPSTSGFIDGFVSLGFPAVVFSIIATFVGKGLSLTVVALDGGAGLIFSKAAMWMALNLLPQFIYACCILWATLGFKKAAKACFNYPALVLTPCIGTWTFSPAAQNNESTSNSKCFMSCESNKISVSYKHTWVTFGITLIGAIVTIVVGYEQPGRELSDFGTKIETLIPVVVSWVLIIVILPILIGFVQGVDKCCNCYTCCPTKCFPVVERIELNVDNMDSQRRRYRVANSEQ